MKSANGSSGSVLAEAPHNARNRHHRRDQECHSRPCLPRVVNWEAASTCPCQAPCGHNTFFFPTAFHFFYKTFSPDPPLFSPTCGNWRGPSCTQRGAKDFQELGCLPASLIVDTQYIGGAANPRRRAAGLGEAHANVVHQVLKLATGSNYTDFLKRKLVEWYQAALKPDQHVPNKNGGSWLKRSMGMRKRGRAVCLMPDMD